MDLYLNALSFTATLIILVSLTLYLRSKNIVSTTDAPMIARIVVGVVLPALLFRQLAFIDLTSEILRLSLYFILAQFLVASISVFVGKCLLKLPDPSLGVFILCSTFGSTAILGSAFISAVFHGDHHAIGTGLLVSQLAVGIPANIFCPIVVMVCGEARENKITTKNIIRTILLAPSTIAIALGLIWSVGSLPTEGLAITPIFKACEYVSGSLVFMVALLNGLSLQAISIKRDFITVISCCFLILVAEPTILYWINSLMQITTIDQQISFMLAAMPSSNSIIAFAIRYKADSKLAATLVTTTVALSALSVPLIMPFFRIFSM
jgi:predicted permease